MAKGKPVLGRGLGALLGSTPIDQPVNQNDLVVDDGVSVNVTSLVEIAKIQPNPFQPRRDFDPERLQELAVSIRRSGVMTAITVRRYGNTFQLISGERRVRASIEAGLTEIPALILNITSDREMMELALVENIQREDLNPIEVAHSYQQLINISEITQEELAESVGKDRSTVTNFIRLLKLPEQIQDSLRNNEISMGHARALLSIPDDETRRGIWETILRDGLSVRRTEAMVKEVGAEQKKNQPRKKSATNGISSETQENSELDLTVAETTSRLRQVLGTQVRIRANANGEGSIMIEFYSKDDLERLLDLIALVERADRADHGL